MKRILLTTTGLTPQVLTETTYALHKRGDTPHEVHVVTTVEGAERARLLLLSDEPGWFQRMRRDWQMPEIHFSDSNVHELKGVEGHALSDVRTDADNAAAADQIAALVQRFTSDADTALHVSIAGGRKTLGYFAGYALSLWGRPQDRLSHVLVNEPYESSWDFFYPTPYERVIPLGKNGERGVADCAKAEVTLADIPFVRLRSGLTPELLRSQASFADAVAAAQSHVGPPTMVLRLRQRHAVVGSRLLRLPPADLAFLAWFARRAKAGLEPLARPRDGTPETDYANGYLQEYRRIVDEMDDRGSTAQRMRRGMSREDFDERKSRLKSALVRQLGAAAQPYLLQAAGRRPAQRFHLPLEAAAITFED